MINRAFMLLQIIRFFELYSAIYIFKTYVGGCVNSVYNITGPKLPELNILIFE